MKRLFSILNSERGSALLYALAAVSLLGLMASASMTLSGVMAADTQRKSQAEIVGRFAQALETITTHPAACMGGTTGNSLSGFYFRPDGATATRTCLADNSCLLKGAGKEKLPVQLGTSMENKKDAVAGAVFDDVEVKALYLTEVELTGTNPTVAKARLMVQLSSLNPEFDFAPREVGVMNLSFNSASELTSCNAAPSAQTLCESMKCTYTPDVPDGSQRCSCGFPEMSCPPGEYVAGYNRDEQRTICQPITLNCLESHGPGFFFAGVDSQGQAICLAAEGKQPPSVPTAPVPSGPVPELSCPPGSSPAGILFADQEACESARSCSNGSIYAGQCVNVGAFQACCATATATPSGSCGGYSAGQACSPADSFPSGEPNNINTYCFCGSKWPNGTVNYDWGTHITHHPYCNSSGVIEIVGRKWGGTDCP